jgi:sugar phosphate isomerase/epimerase
MRRHPRIAVSSPHMSTMRFEALLPRVAEHFAVWEVFGEGEQYLEAIAPAIRELLPSYDLRLTAHAPISDVNIASFNPRVRALALELVATCIRTAGDLGIPTVTVHPGLRMPMARWDDSKLRALTLDAAHSLARLGEEHGVTVCLENMAKNWVMTFQEPDWFEGAFDDTPLRFCLDVAHAHTMGPVTLDAYLRRFTRVTANVHVSDNHGDADSHLVLGQATVPLRETIARLEANGYRGNYVIESQSFDEGLASVAVLNKAARDFLG